MRDVTGKRARILAAGLPPAQAERLVEEAKRIACEQETEDAYATMRWRELVAAAWVSWRLSRPVRARRDPSKRRENAWAGNRVVDGYARETFCLRHPGRVVRRVAGTVAGILAACLPRVSCSRSRPAQRVIAAR